MKRQLSPEEKKKRQQMALGSVIGMGILTIMTTLLSPKNNYSDNYLLDEIRIGNERCPVLINEFIRIDSFSMPRTRTLVSHLTAIDITKDEAEPDTIKKYLEPALLKNIQNDPSLKWARYHRVIFVYSFNDMNGEVFHEYAIRPHMYE